MTERSWPPDPPSPARPYSFALISLNLTNLGRTHSGIVCQGWSFLIELTPCFDPVNVIRKKKKKRERKKQQSRPEGGLWLQRAKAHKRTFFFFFVPMLPKFVSDKGHYFILEYISYNNRLFVFLQPYFHTGVKQRGFIVLAAPRALSKARFSSSAAVLISQTLSSVCFVCLKKKKSHSFCLRTIKVGDGVKKRRNKRFLKE